MTAEARRIAGLPLASLAADQAAEHLPLEVVASGEKTGVRAAVAQGHAKALRGAHGHIRAKVPRRRSSVKARGSAATMQGAPAAWAAVAKKASSSWTEPVVSGYCTSTPKHSGAGPEGCGGPRFGDRDPRRLGAGSLDDVDRSAGGEADGNEELPVLASVGPGLQAVAHHHRLGGGGAHFVQHRGVGDFRAPYSSQTRVLEVQQRFQPALREISAW